MTISIAFRVKHSCKEKYKNYDNKNRHDVCHERKNILYPILAPYSACVAHKLSDVNSPLEAADIVNF